MIINKEKENIMGGGNTAANDVGGGDVTPKDKKEGIGDMKAAVPIWMLLHGSPSLKENVIS